MLSAHQIIQNGLLTGYRIVFVRGLLRYQVGRRLFYSLYDLYKLLLEAGPITQLKSFVPPGATVIDVGANVGFFTTRFAQWTGKGGTVIAIEPEDNNFEELSRRCIAKDLLGIVQLHQAVADSKSGTSHLLVNPDHPGDHRIGEEGLAIEALTIDDLRDAHGQRVAFVKIDVQGAEMRVLAGAERTIATDKPVLFIEIDRGALAKYGTSGKAVTNFAQRHGYLPYRLQSQGPVLLGESDLDTFVAGRGYVDILFLPAAEAGE